MENVYTPVVLAGLALRSTVASHNKMILESSEKLVHSEKYWVVLTQFWVKYGQTQTLG